MRKLTMLTLSAALLGFAGAAGTPANAAPIGNVATVPDSAVTGAESPFLSKAGWRHGHRGYGYRGYGYRGYGYRGYGWRRWHGGGYGYSGGYYPYRYSYGAYPFFYGGPSIYFGFGGHRHHRHWRRWH
jgi:hypothetical protein